ncbi:hypothetical protein RFI_35973 [Reticulomyxa filosa]|uniref:Uncharacterized protein n=1 Tax=Reticulomyxa filosa TaxID=46433 RepID=X6LJE2_RETFI|nr:hypothetical protein RFI_35973 [Reticulomyxa filosa]|eukprot:ETO01466.1 hypothetical protein RFI_35973 [Reticulomyxa filosa]
MELNEKQIEEYLNALIKLVKDVPLRKIVNVFHHINDNSDDQKKDESSDDIEYLWSMIINELHIPQWNLNDTKFIIKLMNGLLLLLDGFDEIANEIKKTQT